MTERLPGPWVYRINGIDSRPTEINVQIKAMPFKILVPIFIELKNNLKFHMKIKNIPDSQNSKFS